MDNPYLQDFEGGGSPQGGMTPRATASENPYMQDFHGEPMPTGAPTADKYHQRAAEILNNIDREGGPSPVSWHQSFLHGATAGLGNRALALGQAAVGQMLSSDGMPFSERLAYTNAMEDEKYRRSIQGNFGTVGEVAGAVMNPLNKIGGARFIPNVAAGAVQGGVSEAADTRDLDKAVQGAGLGAVGAGVGNLIGRGIGAAANRYLPQRAVPDIDQIRTTAQQYEDDFTNSGVYYNPEAMRDLQTNIQDTLNDGRYSRTNHPGIASGPVLPAIENAANNVTRDFDRTLGPKVPTPLDIRDLSRVVQREQGSPSLADYEQRLLSQTQQKLRDFPSSIDPRHVLTGDSVAAGNAWKNANTEYTKVYKSQALGDALEAARNRAMVTGSGGNNDNATRQNILKLLDSRADWTADEKAGLRAVMGEGEDKFMRSMGKMSPQGNGMQQSLAWLSALSNPKTAIAPAVGTVARHITDAEQNNIIDQLDRLIRVGGSANQLPQNSLMRRVAADIPPRLSGPFAQLFLNNLQPAPVQGGR